MRVTKLPWNRGFETRSESNISGGPGEKACFFLVSLPLRQLPMLFQQKDSLSLAWAPVRMCQQEALIESLTQNRGTVGSGQMS